jgi:hypothetical protein
MAATETLNTKDNTNDARLERAKRIIRGLLDRTEDNGCTEAEAMANADKVSELLAVYELSLTDVIARDTSDMVRREVYSADSSAGSVITGIGRLCSLTVYHDNGSRGSVTTYVMFGHAPDVELGVYLYEVVCEAMDHDQQKDAEKHGYSKKRRESFRMGFAGRVATRLTQMREARDAARQAQVRMSGGTDLMVIKDQIVTQEFEKTGIKLKSRGKRTVHDTAAYGRGHAEGSKVNLNNPLTDQRGAMTPLT